MSWQRVPIGYASLKQLLRNGLKTNDSRNYWWPILTGLLYNCDTTMSSQRIYLHPLVSINIFKLNFHSGVSVQAAINEYPDVIGSAEKLHVLISEPLLDHKSMSKIQPTDETELIESVSKNLLYVLKRNKKIDETEYFVALSRILVKELRRIDVCYMIASSLLENQDKYVSFALPAVVMCSCKIFVHVSFRYSAVNYEGNRYNSFAFKEMVKAYLPKTYLSLTTIGALDEKYLNLMFVDFFVEILPENLVLRIVDAYLLEGVKVLYRFGLGLIKGYVEHAMLVFLYVCVYVCVNTSWPPAAQVQVADQDGQVRDGQGLLGVGEGRRDQHRNQQRRDAAIQDPRAAGGAARRGPLSHLLQLQEQRVPRGIPTHHQCIRGGCYHTYIHTDIHTYIHTYTPPFFNYPSLSA